MSGRHGTWAVLGFVALAAGAGDEAEKKKTEDERNRAILAKLEEPFSFKFEDVSFVDVLKFIKTVSQGPEGVGIPIFVDPEGLKKAGVAIDKRVSIESRDGEPLKDALDRLLRFKIGGVHFEVDEGLLKVLGGDPVQDAILVQLERKLNFKFDRVPLEDALISIKTLTKGPKLPEGLPIYIDPVGLQEAGTTMTSPVSVNTKKDEPLKSLLERLLKPLGLTYTVKNGLLTLTSEESADESIPVAPEKGQRKPDSFEVTA